MASNYRGAIVVLADGAEYSGDADLWRRQERVSASSFEDNSYALGLVYWGGTINVESDEAAFQIQQAVSRRLRIEDEGDFFGRKADFTIAGGRIDWGRLQITGSGSCPFDNEDRAV